MRFLPLYFMMIITALSACQKENQSEKINRTSPLLQKVVITNYDNTIYTTTYSYDSQNRFISYKTASNFYTWKSVTAVDYDANHRLSKVTYYTVDDSNQVIKYNFAESFQYDVTNRIIKSIYQPLSATTTGGENHSYGYDSAGRLTADTSLSQVPNVANRYTAFQYDGNNNVIERRQYYGNLSNASYAYLDKYVSTYDNKLNPYSNLGINAYIISRNRYGINANNLIREFRSGDDAQLTTHTYNSNGLLIKSVSYPEHTPQFSSTTEYYYQ